MALQLIKLHALSNETAVTKVGSVVENGAFFLDFSRPIERVRWLGIRNRWIGFTVGLFVPIVHQSEQSGSHIISVGPSDPCFDDLQSLWKAHFPSKRTPPALAADRLRIIADFAAQFPDDSQ